MMSEAIFLYFFVIFSSVTVSFAGLFSLTGGEVRIRYGLTKLRTENLPLNTSAAEARQWVAADPAPGSPFPALQLRCYPDFIVCVWMAMDEAVGIQIGYPKDQISNAPFDFNTQGFQRWSPPGTDMWVTSQYFRSPEILSGKSTLSPSEVADQSVAANVILKQGAVWVQGINNQLTAIPTTAPAIEAADFTEEGCQIGKGVHYIFNLTRSGPECAADRLLHWFPITHRGDVTATGLFLIADVAQAPGQRDWFERPPGLGLRMLVPRAPSCLYQLADSPGIVSTHIYYVTKPNSILCPLIFF